MLNSLVSLPSINISRSHIYFVWYSKILGPIVTTALHALSRAIPPEYEQFFDLPTGAYANIGMEMLQIAANIVGYNESNYIE